MRADMRKEDKTIEEDRRSNKLFPGMPYDEILEFYSIKEITEAYKKYKQDRIHLAYECECLDMIPDDNVLEGIIAKLKDGKET